MIRRLHPSGLTLLGLILGPPGIVLGAAATALLGETIKSALDKAASKRAETVFTLARERILVDSNPCSRIEGHASTSAT